MSGNVSSLDGVACAKRPRESSTNDVLDVATDSMDISNAGWSERINNSTNSFRLNKLLLVQRHNSDKFAECISTAICNAMQSPNAATKQTLSLTSHQWGERNGQLLRGEISNDLTLLDSGMQFLLNNHFISGPDELHSYYYVANFVNGEPDDANGDGHLYYNFKNSKPPFFFIICDVTLPEAEDTTIHTLVCYYKHPYYYVMGGEKNSKVGLIKNPNEIFNTELGRNALKRFVAQPFEGGCISFGVWENGMTSGTQPKPFLLIPNTFCNGCTASEFAWDTFTFQEIKKYYAPIPVYRDNKVNAHHHRSVQVLNLIPKTKEEKEAYLVYIEEIKAE